MTHHDHHHAHPHAPQLQSSPSFLRLSVSQRLLAAAVLIAALWGALFLAMS